VVFVVAGAFSPPTYLHLRMFENAKDYAKLNDINLVGGYFSPVSDAYKKTGLVAGHHRVKMIELATETSDWISVDAWESQQTTFQTTISVLDRIYYALNQDEKGNMDKDPIQVRLLCGADLLESMNKVGLWADEDIKDIVESHGLMVLERINMEIKDIVKLHPVLKLFPDKITIIPQTIVNDISSTKLRGNLANGLSVKYLTSDSVIEYIKQHNLYS